MKGTMDRSEKKPRFVLQRIFLLLWKNILFRRRHWVVTACEIILPTILAMMMAFLRTQLDEGTYKHVDRVSVFPPTTQQELLDYTVQNILCNDCVLAYTPVTPLTDSIMQQFKDKVPDSEFTIQGFGTEREIEKHAAEADLKSAFDDPKLKAAIVFEGLEGLSDSANATFPHGHIFKYRFRPATYTIDTTELFAWFQFPGPELENAAKYTLGGFSGVQILLDKVLIQILTQVEPEQEIHTQVFPYPPYLEVKDFTQFYFILMPQLLVIGFIFMVPSTIRNVVSERESGIKELMKLMGLPNWMHWLGWMLNSLLVLSISISIVVGLFFHTFNAKTGPVILHGDPTLWWAVLFLYIMAATSFCFFISTFSERPTLATTFGVVLWLLSYYSLSVPLEAKYRTLSLTDKLLAALVPNMGLHWAIKVMCGFEGKGAGAQWKNLMEPISAVDGLSVGSICLMFMVDIVMYTLLTLYLECIMPSKYGIRRPWYFLLKPSTWVTDTKKVTIRRQSIFSLHETGKAGFEEEPQGLTPGVVIHKLTKKFGKKKVAVKEISIRMYEGQITALLGHNGAGKTTTMSMLTGLFPPTSGNAYLGSYDIKHQMSQARESLGLCPQHNMLFDKLTVQEHLVFFARIKGLKADEARMEARTLLKKLQLTDKRHTMSQDLSGGMKRKLSLGMALIGGTKVVILDEPTSGMDPEARRVIWDLLLEMRGKRTIVLTTHFMEEADILGDRVAIMSNGKIECYGTPMFLKKYYGTGYTLKMTIGPKSESAGILDRVQAHLPKAFLKTEHAPNAAEIAIAIPCETDTTSKFPAMFSDLSAEKETLGITNIGLSLTTMDEVFVKIGEADEEHDSIENSAVDKTTSLTTIGRGTGDSNGKSNGNRYRVQDSNRLSGLRLLTQQCWALFHKKIIYSFRKRKLLIGQFIISPLLVIAAIYLSGRTYSPASSSPPLTMNLSAYQHPQTLYYTANDTVSDAYMGVVGKSAKRVDGDLIGEMVRLGQTDLGVYREEFVVGAELNASSVMALFSSIPYHAAPLSVNLVSNTLLRAISPGTGYSIQVSVHPLENDLFNILEAAQPNPSFTLLVPIIFGAFVPIGLALFAASYIVFPTEERTCRAKQLQLMTGVNSLVFWGTAFLWDFLLMLCAIIVIVLCFPAFQTYGAYTNNGGGTVILLIFVVWGFSAISFAYLFSFFVSTAAGGFAFKTVLHIGTGMILPIVVFMMDTTQKDTDISIVRYLGRLFPSFGASLSIMRFASIATQNSRCSILSEEDKSTFCDPELEVDPLLLQCCDNCMNFTNPFGPSCFVPQDYLTWTYKIEDSNGNSDSAPEIPGIAQEILFMFLMGLIYQLLLVTVEYGGIRRIIWNLLCKTGMKRFKHPVNDEDVVQEKMRVKGLLESGKSYEDGFLVANMCKNYGNFAAVSNLNFGVHHGECFGLLGVNGAGKTTTFKMLTGDESPSNGNAYSFMNTLQSNRKEFLRNIGYCPQFDGIVGVLTGREMLELFSRLRGVPQRNMKTEVDKWLNKLGLFKAGAVKCQNYSGGMKRRLSVGMAMIGDPPVVLLDEPTSGVDPVARRQFWDVISSLRGSAQCVILTSHSMEECEALCSRLGIMVNGQLQCLGGVQHLKSKFAKGYSLVLRLKSLVHSESEEVTALKQYISRKFSPCELKDEHQNVLQYQILNTEMPWNEIFQAIEDCKGLHKNLIEEYSVSETTLEEVFLSFARKQYPNRDANVSCLSSILTCS